jgi:hypothetical protein
MNLPRSIAALLLAASSVLPLRGLALGGIDLAGNDGRQAPSLESLRARWERFTPEQKERARARYERFLAMSEEERDQLKQSARRLRERSERVQNELQASAPGRLAELDPENRRTIVREIVAEQSRELGARIRTRLPGHWIERIEKARPEDRARFLREFQIQQRSRVARYAIGELGRRLELPKEEIVRMQALPAEGRANAVLELRQRLSEREVNEHGLPPGITPEQWDTWISLSPEEFFEVFQRYWLSRVAEKRAGATRALLEAARPRPEDALALADLTAPERAARLAEAKRARCLKVIREYELLVPTEIEALAAKDQRAFFEGVRRLLGPPDGTNWHNRAERPIDRR